MLNGISAAKNDLITPATYQATNYIGEITRRVYEYYQLALQTNNAMDFDDLLMQAVLLFDERPDVLDKYQRRYRHILVDEFQDTNATQYQLLRQLAGQDNSIFAVGDSDQSIYKWRGADYRNVQNFYRDYPAARTIMLEQNYRSPQVILDAAMGVIRRNADHKPKNLFTERKGGAKLIVREAYNESDEAAAVVDTIEDLMLQGYSGSACAVMYRTNAQSRALEEAFVQAGLPYRLVGATQFYQRREIKDVIAYLRVVHNPRDAVSLGRILNVPTRGIGQATQQQFYLWAAALGLQPAEALVRLANDADVQHPFTGRATNALHTFGEQLARWNALSERAGVGDLLDAILRDTRYQSYLDDGTDEGIDRWENVMELRGVAGADESLSLGDFLQQVALVAETDNLDNAAQATTLLTLHAAKGLEFPIVFITGLEEGLLPHSRSMDSEEELAEERRLFYVGMTRAKDRLYLSHVFRRSTWGDSSVAVPSRFLNDIPDKLLEGGSAGQRRRQSIDRASTWSDTRPSSSTTWPATPRPAAGGYRPPLAGGYPHLAEAPAKGHGVDDAIDGIGLAGRGVSRQGVRLQRRLDQQRHLRPAGRRREAEAADLGHDLVPFYAPRQQVLEAQEAGHEGRRRPVVDLRRRTQLLDASGVHHRQPVGHGEGLGLVVGDVDGGHAHALQDGAHVHHQPFAQRPVERAHRLIEHQQPRPGGQGAGQGHALLLAAGELADGPRLEAGQIDKGQHLRHPRGDLRRRPVAHAQPEGHVLADVLVRE